MNSYVSCLGPARMALAALALLLSSSARAESVFVKYRGMVDLSPFQCVDVARSSVVSRLCYDARNRYVVVKLRHTYYHYCGVPGEAVVQWLEAPSMGRFYNAAIKGHYDCRDH